MRLAAAVILAFALIVNLPAFGLQAEQQRVDQIFAVYDKAGSPGCALGVIRDGNFIYRRDYGEASLELGVPLSPQSVFYMGSVSKQFTAASVVLAAEQGYLSLDDNVRKYLPELADYGHPITLRQMLHHTSGFRDFLTLAYISGRHERDLHSKDETIDLIVRQKGLNNNPGDQFIYSNTNYFLLGEVVKRATKKSLAEFAAENIFRPLGMVHTRFYDDHTLVVPGRVPAYAPGSNRDFLVDWSTNFDTVGAGGLMSSVDDLLLWDRNFYENRLGKGTLLNEMQTRGVLNDGKQINYALGLEIETYRSLPVVEHDGGLFGYRTEILRFPEQRFTVLCLCNLSTANPTRLAHRVADVYLEKSLQPAAVPHPASADVISDAGQFVGKYRSRLDHSVLSFAASGGSLVLDGATLRGIGPNRFETPSGSIIAFGSLGGIMEVTGSYDAETWFAGTRIDELSINGAALAVYAGTYTSTEVDATYKLSVENGNLMLRNNWNPPLKLNPLVRDEFESGDLGTLVFHRDANDRISGLSVFAGRALNVSFEKTN